MDISTTLAFVVAVSGLATLAIVLNAQRRRLADIEKTLESITPLSPAMVSDLQHRLTDDGAGRSKLYEKLEEIRVEVGRTYARRDALIALESRVERGERLAAAQYAELRHEVGEQGKTLAENNLICGMIARHMGLQIPLAKAAKEEG
jgi:hypothetical protein